MTLSIETQPITGAELLDMDNIGPCELIDGRIVRLPFSGVAQGSITARLSSCLYAFATEQAIGWVLTGETGIYIRRNPDTVRGMDIALISHERLPTVPATGYLEVAPELVVEIVSPSDRWHEIEDKISDYFSIGVQQVWVVHPAQQTIYIYRSRSERLVCERDATLQGEGILSGFSLPVASLF